MSERLPYSTTINRRADAHAICAFLDRVCVRQLEVEGLENLYVVRERMRKGLPTILFPNHKSHADGPLLFKSMRENGFDDIAVRLRNIVGTMLMKHPVTSYLTYGYNGILVPADRDYSIDDGVRGLMVRNGLIKARKSLSEADPLVVFAEGGRSKKGGMKKVKPSIAVYLRLVGNVNVFPVAIEADDIWPATSSLPRIRQVGKISFGKQITANYLDAATAELSGEQKDQAMMDTIMYEIARLLPERYQGYYSLASAENSL